MTAPLVPCDGCARHLRADAARCPFCDGVRAPQELAYVPVPRMSRAAYFALGAALTVGPVAALVGSADEAEAQQHHSPPRPVYGVPPFVPRPTPDAGTVRDAGTTPDASVIDAGAPTPPPRRPTWRYRPRDENMPLYGSPPKPAE